MMRRQHDLCLPPGHSVAQDPFLLSWLRAWRASSCRGDGWVVAFHSAVDALQAACELQEALLHADW